MQKEIYGKYNGTHMVTDNGEKYLVPGNYASKSQLLDGDHLRMFVSEQGTFIFKNYNRIPRIRIMATLAACDGKLCVEYNGSYLTIPMEACRHFELSIGDSVMAEVSKSGIGSTAAIIGVNR